MKLKVILVVMFMLVLGMSVGSAKESNWVYIGEVIENQYELKHLEYWLDTSSVHKIQDGTREIVKAKLKYIVNKQDSYTICNYKVDYDTHAYSRYHYEVHDKNDNITFVGNSNTWSQPSQNDIIVNAILKEEP